MLEISEGPVRMFGLDIGVCLGVTLIVFILATLTVSGRQKVVIDTDFAMPPQDDGLALIFALNSPELEILGITTVAGNRSQKQATGDLLRLLEIAGREEISVYHGSDRPLIHEVSPFAIEAHGEWYSSAEPVPPPGGFARREAEKENATDFLVRCVRRNRGEVAVLALGPLTNLAMAIRQDPKFTVGVKKVFLMGGAIASLPDGGGNITPNAEFNFWVDPEAARIVLRSGIPIEMSPLNISRKTGFTRDHFQAIVAVDTPLTRLIKETMEPILDESRKDRLLMYDQVAVAGLIDNSLVKKRRMLVDVDVNPGINYGVSVAGVVPWPGSEGAQEIWVQYDLDWKRFIALFIERISQWPSGRVN
jgi:inosine-uridine nucleoside N-ribohydrolase